MKVTAEIQKRVEQKLKQGLDIANKKYKLNMQMPTINYNLRGTTAGKAWGGAKYLIQFNPTLLMENVDDFIKRTVPHELAHLIHFRVHPEDVRRMFKGDKRDIHGANWQRIMIELGGDPSRCHSYDITNVQSRKAGTVEYTCSCNKTFHLGAKRHQRHQINPCIYCRSCKQYLVLADTQKMAAQPSKPAAKVSQTTDTTKVYESKSAHCWALFIKYSNKETPAELKQRFINEAGCTPAGAQTYLSNCKRAFINGKR